MAIQRKLKHVDGLKELDALLDSLVDPKFRGRALRNAGRKAMEPVKTTLESKLPIGDGDEESYKHYESYTGKKGYQSGDLRKGVKLRVSVNSDKDIKVSKSGSVSGKQKSELYTVVTFDNHLAKLANVLEHGRQKRVATTKNGKLFHYYGNKTDMVQRDIGTTAPKNFVSETFAQCETSMVDTFKQELIKSIEKQAKAYARKKKKDNAGT